MATRNRGWTSLLHLLRSLETEAQRQLQLFHNANDAYERRGFANAVTMLNEVMRTLYDDRSDHIGQEVAKAKPIIEENQNDSAGSTFAY